MKKIMLIFAALVMCLTACAPSTPLEDEIMLIPASTKTPAPTPMPTQPPTPTPTPEPQYVPTKEISAANIMGNLAFKGRNANYRPKDDSARDEETAILNGDNILFPKGELYALGVEQAGSYPKPLSLSYEDQEKMVKLIETAKAQEIDHRSAKGSTYPKFDIFYLHPAGDYYTIELWLMEDAKTVILHTNYDNYYSLDSSELYEFMSLYLVEVTVPEFTKEDIDSIQVINYFNGNKVIELNDKEIDWILEVIASGKVNANKKSIYKELMINLKDGRVLNGIHMGTMLCIENSFYDVPYKLEKQYYEMNEIESDTFSLSIFVPEP